MDLMGRRRWLLQNVSVVNGWKHKSFIPEQDTLTGSTTISAIQQELPLSYRYAVAIINDPDNTENNKFIGCVFIPDRQDVLGVRWRDSAYVTLAAINNNAYDLILRTGDAVDIYWRESELLADEPTTSWNYATIQTGTITRANALQTALENIGNWSVILSVPDIDFNTFPEVNRTYCCSISRHTPNFAGMYIRTNSGAYQSVTNWTSSYDCQVADGTKIANFYLM